jgi:ParB family chromosome partitioning protein
VEIQFRWAVALDKAFEQDPDAVLAAARSLAGRSPKPAAAEVFRALTEAVKTKGKTKAKDISRTFALADGKKGVIRAGKGWAVTVELPRGVLSQARWPAFEEALQKLLSDLPDA